MMKINNSDRGRHTFTKLAVSAFAVLSLCVSTASAQTYIFGRADFSAANNPVSLATGDFNGDGKLDLVVTADNTVSVLLGQVDGTFSSHVDYPTGTYPTSVATGDFNGDGNLDFVVANENCVLVGRFPAQSLSCGVGTLSIFLGNGDGTFQPKVDYSTGSGPAAVVVGDFNGDSKLDLAVANLADGTVSILQGNGDGTFQNQIVYAAVSNQGIVQLQGSLVVADFNGDHKLDLAVGIGAVAILLGNGDGHLSTAFRRFPAVRYGRFSCPGKLQPRWQN